MPKSDKPTKITPADESETAAIEVKVKPSAEDKEVLSAPELPVLEAAEEPAPVPETSSDPVDPETAQAVDDIAAQEADDLLAAEDEKISKAFAEPAPKHGKLRRFFSSWWHSPRKRRATFAVLLLGLLAIFVVPSGRYFVLNSVGVRSSASIVVLDDSTQQPLKNVKVLLGSLEATTDKEGRASFKNIRLGKAKLSLEKRAFTMRERWVVIGWAVTHLNH